MAILRVSDIRKMSAKDIRKRFDELSIELAKERGNIRLGSSVRSPGRLRELRKTIARIKTIQGETK